MRSAKITLFTFLLFALSFQSLNGQNKELVAQKVAGFPTSFERAELLAQRIDQTFAEDIDKVYAVYWWIANNTNYDFKALRDYNLIFRKAVRQDRDNYLELKKQGVADFTVSNNYAVCAGYSNLFEVVCRELGISCKTVSGYSKINADQIGKPLGETDHAWNIVTLNGESFFVDSTWGSGHWNGKFVKEFDDFYFNTDPLYFAFKHYPEDQSDLLMEEPVQKEWFINKPIHYTWQGGMVELLSGQQGTIMKPKQGSLKLDFELKAEGDISWISVGGPQHTDEIKDYTYQDGILKFSYNLPSGFSDRMLTIFLSGSSVLSFKVVH